jgi:predicted O-methyltransferase YrrM
VTITAGRHRVVDLDILEYVAANSSPPDQVQLDLQRATQERTGRSAIMQIGHDQAVMMETLVRATGARTAIEVGTFTGYSALAIARGLPADGKLLCCDTKAEWVDIGREYWRRAGVSEKIEVHIGPALETLRARRTARKNPRCDDAAVATPTRRLTSTRRPPACCRARRPAAV